MKDIDTQAESYLASVKKMNSNERERKLSQIKKLFSKSSEYGDDKVALAMQTYEMVSWSCSLNSGRHLLWILINRLFLFVLQVDKHIRKLDNDLARFEAELKDKSLTSEPAWISTWCFSLIQILSYFLYFFQLKTQLQDQKRVREAERKEQTQMKVRKVKRERKRIRKSTELCHFFICLTILPDLIQF